jgi:hypothetical protein
MCDQPLAVHAIELGLCDALKVNSCSRLERPPGLEELVVTALSVLLRAGLKPPVTELAWSIHREDNTLAAMDFALDSTPVIPPYEN